MGRSSKKKWRGDFCLLEKLLIRLLTKIIDINDGIMRNIIEVLVDGLISHEKALLRWTLVDHELWVFIRSLGTEARSAAEEVRKSAESSVFLVKEVD